MSISELKKENIVIRKKLLLVLILTGVYIIAEVLGGLLTNSLALLADAGHMVADFSALGLSLFATWIVTKPASSEKTYGYHRTEILVALINGVILASISLFIVIEGVKRAVSPPEVEAPLMIVIAFGGLVINIIAASVLHSSAKSNLNIKGAFLHIIGDLLGSIGTIVAGTVIYFYDFYQADLIISFVIATLVFISGVRLILEASNILLESTPSHLDTEKIRDAIKNIPDVKKVHELHVWSICSNRVALSVHVVSDYPDSTEILCKVDKLLRTEFNLEHLTIQVEPSDFRKDKCDF